MRMGYEMCRLLLTYYQQKYANAEGKKNAGNMCSRLSDDTIQFSSYGSKILNHLKDRIERYLISPGPSLVLLDEGHRIKDPATMLSQLLQRISTQRRVVLTGYPIQNKLAEYWCMINFARPGFLGQSCEEFRGTIELPIDNARTNAIASSLTTALIQKLNPLVLRRSESLLKEQLPP